MDLILSVVVIFFPSITSGYSRPNIPFTCRSASSIDLRFSALLKSMNVSFLNSPRSSGVCEMAVDVITNSSPKIISPDLPAYCIAPQSGPTTPSGRVRVAQFSVDPRDFLQNLRGRPPPGGTEGLSACAQQR